MKVDVSLDEGQTWVRQGPIPMNGNPLQPSLVLLPNNTLVAYMRSATQYDLQRGERVRPYRHPTNRKVMVNPGHTFAMVSICRTFDKILEELLTAMEVGDKAQHLLQYLSKCWSKARPIPLPSPNSGLDAVLLGESPHITIG